MITKYTILRPNGQNETGEVDLPEKPSGKELDRILDPIFHAVRPLAHYEHVRIFSEAGQYVSMFVDEESGVLRQPYNEAATREYHRNVIVHRNEPHQNGISTNAEAPVVYGVAVLFSRNVWF